VAQISDSNFSAFVDTMASILEDIERRQAANRSALRQPAPVQLQLPFDEPEAKTPTPQVVRLRNGDRRAA
jgi:hypothetical protein